MSQHEPYTCSLAIMICNNSVDTNTIIHVDSMIGSYDLEEPLEIHSLTDAAAP